jgi:peptidoglycan/LPS O-acetylase OafA/YrhL
MKRFEALDALRGIAALLVVIYHYSTRYYEIYPQLNSLGFTIEFGKLGVNMFFVISGYVIFMTLLKIEKPIDFVITRSIRLYPIFWIAVIFTFIITAIFHLENRSVSFLDMIINLTMIPSLLNTPYVDGVYWTLLYELKFYFLIFLIYLFGFINKIEYLSFIPITIIIVSNLINIEDMLIFKILNFIFFFEYLPYFLSGIMIYKIHEKNYSKLTIIVLILSIIINLTTIEFKFIWFIFFIYFLFILVSINKINWISNKILIYFGAISYSLYLIHQNLGYIVLNYLYSKNFLPLFSFLFALIISIIISSVFTYYIEKPTIKILKNIYKRNYEKINIFLSNYKFTNFLVVNKYVKK